MRRSTRDKDLRPAVKHAGPQEVSGWLNEHAQQMIHCPSQPGNLRLSPLACAKRHIIANEPRWMNVTAEALPLFLFKMNLIPCRRCTIGARCAAGMKDKAA